MRLATHASVAAAGVLIAVKLAVWIATGSVSIMASLLDSLLDAGASMVNLFAVRHSLTPPDREHRFGHGKAEPLAGLAQSAFIAGSAVLLLVQAAERLTEPRVIPHAGVGIAVMGFSMLVTIALVIFQRRVIARTNSTAIRADSLHYAGDIMVNGGVIVALLLAKALDAPIFDPLFGALIAFYILYSAWQIVRLSLDMLMDRELPEADRRRIRDLCLQHTEVRRVHDLRTRVAGPDIFIQAHIEMDGAMTLLDAHAVSDDLEKKLKAAFPDAEVMIHQDPAGIAENRPHFA
ncbi:MAG: cation diffusion facilitator family transporter [Alphaproteobacteria bacterium]|nr:cation diffusion facilitator family transporter [Alphaproteobacteria bacterium]